MICVDRNEEVWSALNAVTDPEIDESVVSLDFVTDVKIDSETRVKIDFRLPTYWCAPNFAFLMASAIATGMARPVGAGIAAGFAGMPAMWSSRRVWPGAVWTTATGRSSPSWRTGRAGCCEPATG